MNKNIIALSDASAVSMADEWFDLATANHFWMEWRFQVIKGALKKIQLIDSSKFLEIGCGHGEFMKQSSNQLGLLVDGCDLNTFALSKISARKGQVFVYNIYDLHPDMINKYDGVFLLDVIEHVDNDNSFLNTSAAHVKKGGYLIINVPALMLLYSKYDKQAGHKRRYSKRDLHKLFKELNIEPVHIGYWGFSLFFIALIRKLFLVFIPSKNVIKSGFKPPSKLFNKALKIVSRIEISLIKKPVFGSSLIAIGRIPG